MRPLFAARDSVSRSLRFDPAAAFALAPFLSPPLPRSRGIWLRAAAAALSFALKASRSERCGRTARVALLPEGQLRRDQCRREASGLHHQGRTTVAILEALPRVMLLPEVFGHQGML